MERSGQHLNTFVWKWSKIAAQKSFFFCWFCLDPPSYGIGATIRIGREMLCLPYAGFFYKKKPRKVIQLYKFTQCRSKTQNGGRVSKSCDHATVRSRKNVHELRKIWIFEPKNASFTTFSPFLGHFLNFFRFFLCPFTCAKFPNKNFGHAKLFAFRKSDMEVTHSSEMIKMF